MLLIMPYQGHGWGYRYLHPVLPNIILLTGYGYRRWASADEARANGTICVAASVYAFLALPFLLFTSHQYTSAHASITALAQRQTADFVLIDTESFPIAIDSVRNLPDLSNRPLIFATSNLSESQLAELCDRGSIAVITVEDIHRVGSFLEFSAVLPSSERRIKKLSGGSCLQTTAAESGGQLPRNETL
jgi:hypothetical protein